MKALKTKIRGLDRSQFKRLKELTHYNNLIYDYQAFSVKNGTVLLEKGLSFPLPEKLVDKTIKQVEIVPKYRHFEAIFVYEEDENNTQVTPNDNIMAIDLGLNNLATCVTNGVAKPFIVDGRKLKSINHHYNKHYCRLQSHLKKTRLREWSNRLQRLTDRRNAQIGDYLHKATRQVTNICVENGISKVVVGDVSKSLDQINLGKKTNQNFVNLSLGQFIDKLRYKLELHGITLDVTNESYTSKASFIDGDCLPKKYEPKKTHSFNGKRVKRGLYRSQNGTTINADANGAYNILRKSNPKFSFSELTKKVGEGILDWLHPYTSMFKS